MSLEGRQNETTGQRVAVPVEVVCLDEMTARAIAKHQGQGGSLVIDGRCYLELQRAGRRTTMTLRVVAEQVLFVADRVSSVEPSDQALREAS